jgi:hypothetical protein
MTDTGKAESAYRPLWRGFEGRCLQGAYYPTGETG